MKSRKVLSYLSALTVLLFEEKAREVHKPDTFYSLQPVASRIALLTDNLVRVIVQVVFIGLMAVPEVHHLGPILVRQISPLSNLSTRYYRFAATVTSDRDYYLTRYDIKLH